MTKQDFLANVNYFDELIDFCNDEECDICGSVYDEYDRDEIVEDWIAQTDRGWEEIKELLNYIPTGFSYYLRNEDYEWTGLDDNDFEYYKDEVTAWMDDGGFWEEPEEDENSEPDTAEAETEDNTPIEDEDFSVSELLISCSEGLKAIQEEQEYDRQKDEEEFTEFISPAV